MVFLFLPKNPNTLCGCDTSFVFKLDSSLVQQEHMSKSVNG